MVLSATVSTVARTISGSKCSVSRPTIRDNGVRADVPASQQPPYRSRFPMNRPLPALRK